MFLRWPLALLFLAPALVLYGVFTLLPAGLGVGLSLTNSTGVGSAQFVGLDNFARMFTDPVVGIALRNVLIYVVFVTVVQNALGLAFALALAQTPSVRNFLRAALLTPSMISALIAGFVWSSIYSPLGGGLNEALKAIGLGGLARAWLGDSSTALIAIAVVNVWMFTGYSAVIWLTGYLSIPQELLDSAALDGANGWQRFRYIEWAMLAPAATVNLTLTLIGASKVFELPLVMTRGGPGDVTQVPGLFIYHTAFSGNRFGYGTALALSFALIVVLVSTLQSHYLRNREKLL